MDGYSFGGVVVAPPGGLCYALRKTGERRN